MKRSILIGILFLVATANIAVAAVATPVVFALQIAAGAWRGFRNASYIMRYWVDTIIKKFLEGVRNI